MARGCCWRNTSVVFLLGIVCLLLGPAKGKFTPVDISPLERYHLDETKLTSAKYFRSWLANVYNPIGQKMAQSAVQASWDYNTNITAVNEAATIESSQASANLTRLVAKIAAKFDLSKSRDTRMKTTQKKMKELGDASLDPAELTELVTIVNGMESVYSTATICFDPNADANEVSLEDPTNCEESKKLPLDPDLINFMKNSTWDAKKRQYVWKAWRDVSGKKVRKDYIRYIQLKNKAAKLTGYNDNGQYWRSEYTDENAGYTDSDFLKNLNDIWLQIKPIYGELHAYVRRKLINKLPLEHLSPTGPIPAYLIGDMFSQEWTNMLNFTQLFPAKPLLDVTDEMKRQNYTVDKMFHLSEQFQIELGLKPMPEIFWEKSLFVKPKDGREVVCHASAWDFYRTGDVRIKMCTEVNMDDLITIHHEMGHIQYFLQYADQLLVFRDGANSGFHEAVGDTLALSVKTPKHLSWLGLLKNNNDDRESDLNYMFSTALEKIAFLPFAYIMDRYRYDVFSGKIGTNELNSGWWNYVLEYQGIIPGVPRTEDDFDPGAKYHIDADVEYMRYFISFVIQFQFHKALCDASGHAGPLYQCDINQSKKAGELLSSMLSLGSSQSWPVAMEKITGSRVMDAAPLLEFFQPLTDYLKAENRKNGDVAGW